MRLATLLLAAAFIVGCTEIGPIEPPPPGPEPFVPEEVPELPAMTLKGPEAVTQGDAPMYKAGSIAGASRYVFELNSGALVLTSEDVDADRYFFTEVAGEGRVELRVTAYNADNEAVAFARRWIESRF
ncbi:MAG: hypothetical protein AAFQ43_07585 [Bacteroidota bacterium]